MSLEKKIVNSALESLSRSRCRNFDSLFTKEFIARLSSYYGFLQVWNKKLNLSRIFSSPEYTRDEFIISPAFYSHVIKNNATKILDIGSGNGIPAIFCSLAHPEKSFTLCEIDYRKAIFLQELCRSMNLLNVKVINSDFALLHVEEYRYDHIMFKNVSCQSNFLESVVKLLNTDGSIVFQTATERVESFRHINPMVTLSASYNIPVEKKSCLLELSIVPRETM